MKCKKIHNDVKQELKSHIEELYEYNISKGLSEKSAMENAIKEMGNSSEVGMKINEQHKPQTNWVIIALTMIVALFGTAIMFVSSKFDNGIISFSHYILYAIMGVGLLIGTYFFDYTLLKKSPYVPLGIGFVIFVATIFLGVQVNGAYHYIRLVSQYINASPIISLLFLISFIAFIDKYKASGFIGIVKLILIGGLTFIPFLSFPDIASASILLVTYAIILLTAILKGHFGGNKKVQAISIIIFGIIVVGLVALFLIIESPHRLQRIITFFAGGYNDPANSGWIMVMADKVLNSSNWIGVAEPLVEGNIDYILPGITDVYVLLNIMSHFGIIAGIILIAIVALLIARMFVTSYKIKNSFGLYISIGASSLLAVQFVLNILMNFNLIPFSDIIMPFVSYGGTWYIFNMLLIGLVLSVWRRNNIIANDGTIVETACNFIEMENGKLIIDFNLINPTKSK